MSRLLAPSARVVVRMPSWLGDCVMVEPLVRALAASRSHGGSLTLCGPTRVLAWLSSSLRDVAIAETSDFGAWRERDVALLLDGSWRSAWRALRAGVPERVGFASGARAPLLTLALRAARERGATPLQLGTHGRGSRRLPRPFGTAAFELAALAGLQVRERVPRIDVDPERRERVASRVESLTGDSLAAASLVAVPLVDASLASARAAGASLAGGSAVGAFRAAASHRPLAVVNAAGRDGSAKAVPLELWSRIVPALVRDGFDVVVASAPGEETLARELGSRANVPVLDPPPDLADLAALFSLASVVMTADSGARHVAQAVGAPVVVLCGPTDPRHTGEHAANVRVLAARVPCGPCHLERCPRAGVDRHVCWNALESERAASLARTLSRR